MVSALICTHADLASDLGQTLLWRQDVDRRVVTRLEEARMMALAARPAARGPLHARSLHRGGGARGLRSGRGGAARVGGQRHPEAARRRRRRPAPAAPRRRARAQGGAVLRLPERGGLRGGPGGGRARAGPQPEPPRHAHGDPGRAGRGRARGPPVRAGRGPSPRAHAGTRGAPGRGRPVRHRVHRRRGRDVGPPAPLPGRP